MQPIFETSFEATELVKSHPPRPVDPNKQIVFRLACPPLANHTGTISFARYPSAQVPRLVSSLSRTVLECREGIFTYEPERDSGSTAWYLNFANTHLFCAYGGRAFAQDELQVVEHPALGALREALVVSAPGQLLTVEDGEPTPVLIMGVERRCRIATAAGHTSTSLRGIYGNRFSAASPEVVEAATHLVEPTTFSNILAIEAPTGGTGRYTRAELEFILRTAYAGFYAARLESGRRLHQTRESKVVIHTGFWGCGVYGNDRVLMALMQFLAARLADIDLLVFHTADESGASAYNRAHDILENELFSRSLMRRILSRSSPDLTLPEVLARVDGLGFRWGEGDGN